MILKSTMTIRLAGKMALPTGFDTGVGLTTAEALAQEGEQVITQPAGAPNRPLQHALAASPSGCVMSCCD